MKQCGWIKTDKGYATSCGHNGKYHRGYIYCPWCGNIIKLETAYDKCERLLVSELAKGIRRADK